MVNSYIRNVDDVCLSYVMAIKNEEIINQTEARKSNVKLDTNNYCFIVIANITCAKYRDIEVTHN